MAQIAGILLRVGITYLYLLVVLRLAGKRDVRAATPFDFVVSLVIGDMPDDIILGQVPLAQGLVAMGTIMLLHLLVVYFAFISIPFDRLVGSGPSPLLKGGQLVRATMARERINEEEVKAMVREQQIEDWGEVEEAILEPSGVLTVQRREAAKPAEKRALPILKDGLV